MPALVFHLPGYMAYAGQKIVDVVVVLVIGKVIERHQTAVHAPGHEWRVLACRVVIENHHVGGFEQKS